MLLIMSVLDDDFVACQIGEAEAESAFSSRLTLPLAARFTPTMMHEAFPSTQHRGIISSRHPILVLPITLGISKQSSVIRLAVSHLLTSVYARCTGVLKYSENF